MKKTLISTWEYIACLLVCFIGGAFMSFILVDTKLRTEYYRYWEIQWKNKPVPIKYVDTCASYQPLKNN